jgi:hypothetical protein
MELTAAQKRSKTIGLGLMRGCLVLRKKMNTPRMQRFLEQRRKKNIFK